jgi:hypothetical protein
MQHVGASRTRGPPNASARALGRLFCRRKRSRVRPEICTETETPSVSAQAVRSVRHALSSRQTSSCEFGAHRLRAAGGVSVHARWITGIFPSRHLLHCNRRNRVAFCPGYYGRHRMDVASGRPHGPLCAD